MSTTVHTVDISQPDYQWSGVDRIELEDNTATAYVSGSHNTYIVRCKLPRAVKGDGVAASIYLGDWQHIDYVAIGYSQTSGFKHIKAQNIRQNAWVDLGFTHNDIIWQLQNGHQQTSDVNIDDIKLFIKGDPGQATVKLRNLQLVQTAPITTPPMVAVEPGVISVLTMHFRRALRDYNFAATEYMTTGQCPMPGKQLLPWGIAAEKPETLSSVNSFCSAWHGMHLPIALMLYAEDTQTTAPLMAARVLIEQWLDNSYFKPDSDVKYTWYDHGTAERLLAFILLWHKCAEQGQDTRFANRLWQAIDQHAELLNSEAFYAYHQPTRYHNHAWFQDTALIAAALAFPEQAQAEQWLTNGIGRFEDQLEKLIVRDGSYAIFVENSIGYHHGVQKLAEVVGALVQLSGRDTEIPQVAQELTAWSDFLRYPDGRVPAQGDTFRLPPRTGNDIRRGKPWEKPGCTVLPKAGYAVVKGNHDNKPWMLCLFNTSLSETHKHEDNLSITFWFDGIEWLIDPSFYSHEYDQQIPQYLRSAAAHNTISIEGAEFDINHADTHLINNKPNFTSEFSLTALHNAFKNYTVKREIEGSLDKLDFRVNDCVSGTGKVPASLSFIVGENIKLSSKDGVLTMEAEGSEYIFRINLGKSDVSLDEKPVGIGFMSSSSAKAVKITISECLGCQLSWNLSLVPCAVKPIFTKSNLNSVTQPVHSEIMADKVFQDKSIGNVLLIGSCVTRDAMSYVKTDSIDYYARTSLISLASPPVPLPDMGNLESIGNFERRMILSDFDKRLVEALVPGRYDVVLLDLIDERFDLAMINDSCVTYSNYLIQSGFLNHCEGLKIRKRFTLNNDWLDACNKIFEKLKLLGVPIILHKAWWAERFYNHSTGEIEFFDEDQLKVVRKYNELLAFYYDAILNIYPQVITVEVDSRLLYSDFAHKWGRDYFHYSDLYYRRLSCMLVDFLRGDFCG